MGSAKTALRICGCNRLMTRDPMAAGAGPQILARMNFVGITTRPTARPSRSFATIPNPTWSSCASQAQQHNDGSHSLAIRADFLDLLKTPDPRHLDLPARQVSQAKLQKRLEYEALGDPPDRFLINPLRTIYLKRR